MEYDLPSTARITHSLAVEKCFDVLVSIKDRFYLLLVVFGDGIL